MHFVRHSTRLKTACAASVFVFCWANAFAEDENVPKNDVPATATTVQKTAEPEKQPKATASDMMKPAASGKISSPLEDAVRGARPILDVRFRFETVDQDNFAEDAQAITGRVRAGLETAPVKGTSFLIDFEHVEAFKDDYNSLTNGNLQFPVVADPTGTELNRIQLTNTSIKDTKIIFGRQRIILDDGRFVGNHSWRQNEQTFDGVRVINTGIKNLKLDASYITQVNRFLGDASPAGRWESQSSLLDAEYSFQNGDVTGTVGAFAHHLGLDDAPTMSSKTVGVKGFVDFGKISGMARYAVQTDYDDNPNNYRATYWMIEGQYAKGPLSAAVGIETLGSDQSAASFQTPLASLHSFNGFADQFAVTPTEGLEDIYAKVSYMSDDAGSFDKLKAWVAYHDFTAEDGGAEFGEEIDLGLHLTKGKLNYLVKYSDYTTDDFGTDSQKLFIQTDWAF